MSFHDFHKVLQRDSGWQGAKFLRGTIPAADSLPASKVLSSHLTVYSYQSALIICTCLSHPLTLVPPVLVVHDPLCLLNNLEFYLESVLLAKIRESNFYPDVERKQSRDDRKYRWEFCVISSMRRNDILTFLCVCCGWGSIIIG